MKKTKCNITMDEEELIMTSGKLKTLVTAAVMGIASISAVPAVNASAETVKESVIKGVSKAAEYDLALRYLPSWAYGVNVKDTVKKGDQVIVLSEGEVFSYVSWKGKTGYVPTMYLSETDMVYIPTEIGTYMDAESAAEGKNAVGYYPAGYYYIYKNAEGMVNISTQDGIPGRWVNPMMASIPETETMTIDKAYLTYLNSDDAKAEKNALPGSYPAGKYFIFNEYQGMVNITKTKGIPGRWINPETEKFPEAVKTVELKKSYYTYMTAQDAEKGENSLAGTYDKGTYFIYKDSGKGIYNISKTAGQAGRWININADDNVMKEVRLSRETYTYISAEDAAKEENPLSTTYKPGIYFVYRYYNGMYNISTEEGIPGRWVNPDPKKNPEEVKTYDLKEENYTYMNADDAEAEENMLEGTYVPGKYYIFKKAANGMINLTTVPGQAGRWINPNAEEFPGKVPVVKLSQDYVTFMNAQDAENLENPLGLVYKAGTYYIYKGEGNIINVTVNPAEPGRWINLSHPSIPAAEEPETETVTVGVTARYKNAEDAQNGKDSVGNYPAGTYYIYKNLGNGILNITTVEGQAGSWVNLK